LALKRFENLLPVLIVKFKQNGWSQLREVIECYKQKEDKKAGVLHIVEQCNKEEEEKKKK
jgi:hypothetical protein